MIFRLFFGDEINYEIYFQAQHDGEYFLLHHKKLDIQPETKMCRNDSKHQSRQNAIFKKLSKANSIEHENDEGHHSVCSSRSSESVAKRLDQNYRVNRQNNLTVDKSSIILVIIVTLFILTHSTRMASKLYVTIFPHLNTKENFIKCLQNNR